LLLDLVVSWCSRRPRRPLRRFSATPLRGLPEPAIRTRDAKRVVIEIDDQRRFDASGRLRPPFGEKNARDHRSDVVAQAWLEVIETYTVDAINPRLLNDFYTHFGAFFSGNRQTSNDAAINFKYLMLN
jgi:hypothetical protein